MVVAMKNCTATNMLNAQTHKDTKIRSAEPSNVRITDTNETKYTRMLAQPKWAHTNARANIAIHKDTAHTKARKVSHPHTHMDTQIHKQHTYSFATQMCM